MTTHTHAINAARSAGHPSMEVLTAAEADAIVGGRIIDSPLDFDIYRDRVVQWLKGNRAVKKVVDTAKDVVNWLRGLF